MARYYDDELRYDTEIESQRSENIESQIRRITTDDSQQIDQITPDQVTADQNNYSLPEGELVRLTTDAARTFTGFAGARPGRFVIANVGSFDVVIANNSASSNAENRVLCHTGANITLNPGESTEIIYDFESLRWRTIGFV